MVWMAKNLVCDEEGVKGFCGNTNWTYVFTAC